MGSFNFVAFFLLKIWYNIVSMKYLLNANNSWHKLNLGKCPTWPYLYFWCTFSRHFSHVIKSRIFKNLNLREKADRNFRPTFLKNRFRHLKLYSNTQRWLARGCCHMGTVWKTKYWSSHFWEGQPFRFWYVKCHCHRRLKSTKTGISS